MYSHIAKRYRQDPAVVRLFRELDKLETKKAALEAKVRAACARFEQKKYIAATLKEALIEGTPDDIYVALPGGLADDYLKIDQTSHTTIPHELISDGQFTILRETIPFELATGVRLHKNDHPFTHIQWRIDTDLSRAPFIFLDPEGDVATAAEKCPNLTVEPMCLDGESGGRATVLLPVWTLRPAPRD